MSNVEKDKILFSLNNLISEVAKLTEAQKELRNEVQSMHSDNRSVLDRQEMSLCTIFRRKKILTQMSSKKSVKSLNNLICRCKVVKCDFLKSYGLLKLKCKYC